MLQSFDELNEFLRWRTSLHGVATNEDEMVFAGFYLRHGPEEMPETSCVVQLDPNYSDVFDTTYFQQKGVPIKMPKERTAPVWSLIKKEGDEIVCSIDGKSYDAVNWKTGGSRYEMAVRRQTPFQKSGSTRRERVSNHAKIGPNMLCPCGSGENSKDTVSRGLRGH